jgi:hypothetical protein
VPPSAALSSARTAASSSSKADRDSLDGDAVGGFHRICPSFQLRQYALPSLSSSCCHPCSIEASCKSSLSGDADSVSRLARSREIAIGESSRGESGCGPGEPSAASGEAAARDTTIRLSAGLLTSRSPASSPATRCRSAAFHGGVTAGLCKSHEQHASTSLALSASQHEHIHTPSATSLLAAAAAAATRACSATTSCSYKSLSDDSQSTLSSIATTLGI